MRVRSSRAASVPDLKNVLLAEGAQIPIAAFPNFNIEVPPFK